MGQDIWVNAFAGSSVAGRPPEIEDAGVQYQLSRVVMGPALHLLGRPKVTGLEYIPASGPAILASNHLSFVHRLDVPAAGDLPAGGVPRQGRVLHREGAARPAVGGVPALHQPT